jgi:hypothetical protein
MNTIHKATAALLLLVMAAQMFLAASGAAGHDFGPHKALGYVTFVLPLVLAIVAALARKPRRAVVLPVVIAALVSLQVLIAKVAEHLDAPYLFGLHGLNGVVILALAGAVQRSKAYVWPTSETPNPSWGAESTSSKPRDR